MALPRNIFDTTQRDLERFIAERAVEGPHLDFKRDFPATWDNATRNELLADVGAFANAGGGDLVFGIEEDGNAQAIALVPQRIDADLEVRRIQDFLMNLVEPRIPAVQVVAVPVEVGGAAGSAVVIRAPQSWAGPHRVRPSAQFFLREGVRKRQLDVPEIRALFLRSDAQTQRVRDFRTERLAKILVVETPHKLVEGPVLVAHFIPTQAALGLMQVDPVVYTRARQVPVLARVGDTVRMNIDGVVAIRNPQPVGTHGYGQFFRNGFLETVMVLGGRQDGRGATLPSLSYEQQLIALLVQVRGELEFLGASKDAAVLLSLLRADQVQFGVGQRYGGFDEPRGFDRSMLIFPDVLLEGDTAPEIALKPLFDLVWQAAGYQGSGNYNDEGQWAPR